MKNRKVFLLSCITILIQLLHVQISFAQTKINVLVFSKTAAFRHLSIEAGKTALSKMAQEKGFGISFSEDASQFTELNLKKFNSKSLCLVSLC